MDYPLIPIHNVAGQSPMPAEQVRALARRDLVVLSPDFRKDDAGIAEIRRLNPKIVILQRILANQSASPDFPAGRWADPEWRKAFDGFFLDEGRTGSRRGLAPLARRLRELCGDRLLIVLNNRDCIVPAANGGYCERFVDMAAPERSLRNWAFFMEALRAWIELGHRPSVVLTSSQSEAGDDYRQMRFGLASALLHGGYYQYHARPDAEDWRNWFDEYSAEGRNWLGKPLGPPRQALGDLAAKNRMAAGGWEIRLGSPAAAFAEPDEQGDSVRVDISRLKVRRADAVRLSAKGAGSLPPDREYTLALDVHASSPRLIDVTVRSGGRVRSVSSIYLKTQWARHAQTLYIQPGEDVPEFELSFELGRDEGTVDFDRISLRDGVAEAGWIREFEHGLAVVNPTRLPRAVAIPPGFRKIRGAQDPRHNDGTEVKGSLRVEPLDAYLLVRT